MKVPSVPNFIPLPSSMLSLLVFRKGRHRNDGDGSANGGNVADLPVDPEVI